MKKIIAFLMVIVVCLSFTACTGFGINGGEYTLESLREEYRPDMLAHARSLVNKQDGEFEIVILEKEETIKNLQIYTISENLDMDKIVRGLFVKFNPKSENGIALQTVYYNYALELSEKQSKDIGLSFEGSDEVWLLEVVKENKKLLFEYSIVDSLR